MTAAESAWLSAASLSDVLLRKPSAQIAGPQLPPVQMMVELNGVAWL